MVNHGSAERIGRAMAASIIFTALMGLWPAANHAQELEARTYSNAPVGLNFIGGAYVFSTGNVLVDPSLPVEGLESDLHLFALRYTRTIGFLGKNAKLKLVLPIAKASFTGFLAGESRSRAIEGFGDARAIFELNFLGAPALEPREFGGYRQATIVGTSLAVILPTGQYDADKLLNLGTNRWGFRPEIGVSRAVGRWTLEATGTVWLYTDNDDFFGGQLLDQDPLYALQGHVIFNKCPIDRGAGAVVPLPAPPSRQWPGQCRPTPPPERHRSRSVHEAPPRAPADHLRGGGALRPVRSPPRGPSRPRSSPVLCLSVASSLSSLC